MNIILDLFDEKKVKALLEQNWLAKNSNIASIRSIKITPHKQYVWPESHHVVAEFYVTYFDTCGQKKRSLIFCLSHWKEDRKAVFEILQFLLGYQNKLGGYTTPTPLFYLEKYKALFYDGFFGKTIQDLIAQKLNQHIEKALPQVAKWLARLHAIKIPRNINFHKHHNTIATSIPGIEKIMRNIQDRRGEQFYNYDYLYQSFLELEKKYRPNFTPCFVHGDAHPGNFIARAKNKIAVIDFTDFCVADGARDVGTFLEQLEFMMFGNNSQKIVESYKNIFLNSYAQNAKIKIDQTFMERIELYRNWTALRTATFFLLKHDADIKSANAIIEKIIQKIHNAHRSPTSFKSL